MHQQGSIAVLLHIILHHIVPLQDVSRLQMYHPFVNVIL